MPLAAPVAKLKLMPGNPRRGNVDAVAASLEAFGQRKPVVALRDGTVIAGNHTLQAAARMGWDKIAVVWVDDDDATAKAYSLADNRTAELGGYDDSLLADLIAEVAEADEALLATTAWTTDDLDELLDRLGDDTPPQGDPNDVPEPPKVAVTKPGDVWLLGAHRLVCGDSTDSATVAKAINGRKANMVWTDPPYGVSYVGKTSEALTVRNDGADEFESIISGAFDQVVAGCEPGAAIYVAAPAGPQGITFAEELHKRGLFRQRLVWVKDVLVLGHSDYHYRHEDVYFGYAPGAKGRRGRGGDGWYGDNSQTSVLEFTRPKANREHPTMKPVELIKYCIKNSSRRDDLVLDVFGGSGSTLIAAHDTGRVAALVELDPTYCDVICRRFQEHAGVVPILEASGDEHDFTA